MSPRKTYRKLSFLTHFRGMKNAIGEMRGIGFPTQPSLNQQLFQERNQSGDTAPYDENWFIQTMADKVNNHPENAMEGPKLYG